MRKKSRRITFPENAKAVVDVTKAPYSCDPTGWRDFSAYGHFMIEESREGVMRKIKWDEFPKRQGKLIAVPLYVGRGREETKQS